jgi:MFS family permease
MTEAENMAQTTSIASAPEIWPPGRVAWFVWSFGALFYLMGFFQRVAPAVMTTELMRDFNIHAAALGNLSALYFYSYVAMQIPTGIIADRWGPRKLLATGALVASIGTVLFAASPQIMWAYVGRFLIGGSVAVAFVGLLKVAVNWFPPRKFAMVSGMALFFGIIGAVSAGPPLRLLIDTFHWRTVLLFSAGATLAISAGIWFFVTDHPADKGWGEHPSLNNRDGKPEIGILAGIKEVFSYRNIILLFIIPGGIVGPVLAFSGLWGVPFLTTHYGLTGAKASVLTSALLVAWAVGGPLFGWYSDRLGARKPPYIVGCIIALAGWALILFVPGLPISLLVIALVVAGFSSGAMVISFAYAKESVSPLLSGTVSGVVNMGIMMGPMILQPVVGVILDHYWTGMMEHGVRVYDLSAYRAGFTLMFIWSVISLILLFFTKETHCRQVD